MALAMGMVSDQAMSQPLSYHSLSKRSSQYQFSLRERDRTRLHIVAAVALATKSTVYKYKIQHMNTLGIVQHTRSLRYREGEHGFIIAI